MPQIGPKMAPKRPRNRLRPETIYEAYFYFQSSYLFLKTMLFDTIMIKLVNSLWNKVHLSVMFDTLLFANKLCWRSENYSEKNDKFLKYTF